MKHTLFRFIFALLLGITAGSVVDFGKVSTANAETKKEVEKVSSCSEAGVDYFGNDINNGHETKKNSAEECHQLCQSNDNCVAFTWVQLNVPSGPLVGRERECWIKHKQAIGIPVQYVVSGTKDCGYDYFHDGHCASGWLGGNTMQATILECYNHCITHPQCFYFAYDNSGIISETNCALYGDEGCTDDNNFPAYNAYKMIRA
jgi:hypothetical protein